MLINLRGASISIQAGDLESVKQALLATPVFKLPKINKRKSHLMENLM
jgi:hypothetical protein